MDRVSPTLLLGGRFNLHSPEAVPHRFTSMERWKRETKKQNELGSVNQERNVMRRTKVLTELGRRIPFGVIQQYVVLSGRVCEDRPN